MSRQPKLRFKDGRPIDVRIELAVLVAYNLTPIELAVYVAIVSFASYQDHIANPGFKTIADRARVSRASVIRAIARLEELKLLTVKREKSDGVHQVNTYTVNVATPGVWSQPDTTVVSDGDYGGSVTETPKRKPVANVNQEQRLPEADASAKAPIELPKVKQADMFGAITDALGLDANTLTEDRARSIGKVARQLIKAGYLPEDVGPIRAWVKQRYNDSTEHALSKYAPSWKAEADKQPAGDYGGWKWAK